MALQQHSSKIWMETMKKYPCFTAQFANALTCIVCP